MGHNKYAMTAPYINGIRMDKNLFTPIINPATRNIKKKNNILNAIAPNAANEAYAYFLKFSFFILKRPHFYTIFLISKKLPYDII